MSKGKRLSLLGFIVGTVAAIVALTPRQDQESQRGAQLVPPGRPSSALLANPNEKSLTVNSGQNSYPTNGLGDLVQYSDLIVLGEVGAVTDQFDYHFYPTSTPDPNAALPPLPEGIKRTIYDLEVLAVYKGDVSVEDHISMQMLGSPDHPFYSEFDAKGSLGEQYLYFIIEVEDDYYGVPYGPYGRLDVSGSTVRVSDYEGGIAPFATNLSPSQFIASVQTEVSTQLTATPTAIPTETPDEP